MPVREILQTHGRKLAELRQQMPGTLDRTSHELWKKTHERGKAKKVPFPMHSAQVKVNRVTQGLERKKRDADREQVVETEGHERRRIR
jgi:hypothetical protein